MTIISQSSLGYESNNFSCDNTCDSMDESFKVGQVVFRIYHETRTGGK